MGRVTIYVRLLDEGVDVWRPVKAEQVGSDLFRIDPNVQMPEGEQWEFSPGERVLCRWRRFENGEGWEALEKIEER